MIMRLWKGKVLQYAEKLPYLIYQHYYHSEKELYRAIEEFAYVQYNHVRPHSYNNYKTPYKARYGVI